MSATILQFPRRAKVRRDVPDGPVDVYVITDTRADALLKKAEDTGYLTYLEKQELRKWIDVHQPPTWQ